MISTLEGTGAVLCLPVSGYLLGENFNSSFVASPPFSWLALITCYNYSNVDFKISCLEESCNKDPSKYMSQQILLVQGKKKKKKSFAGLVSKHYSGKGSGMKEAVTRRANKSSHCKAASLNKGFAEYVGKMQTAMFGKVTQVERREWIREKKKELIVEKWKKEEMIVEEWKRFARVVDRWQHLLYLYTHLSLHS